MFFFDWPLKTGFTVLEAFGPCLPNPGMNLCFPLAFMHNDSSFYLVRETMVVINMHCNKLSKEEPL